MRKRHLLIFNFLLIIFQTCFNQIVPELNGYIVNYKNDTTFGTVKVYNDLSKKISFKNKNDVDFKEYNPFQIKSFYYSDNSYYNAIEVIEDKDTLTIFALLIVDGEICLYKREDFYYIVRQGYKTMKIEKRDKIKGDKFIEDKKYLGILKYFMSDCNQIVDKINNVGFYESELSKIISKYNNYKNPQSKSISHLNHDQYVTKFGIRFGKIIGSLIYSDDSDWGHSANFSQIINYTGGCFINLAYKNFSIQPEILLTKKASTLLRKGSLWNQFTFISSSYLQVPISIYYSFQYKKFKPLISVGAIIGHAISQNTYRIENNNISQLLYYKDEYGFRGGLGLEYQLKNKFSIGLEYIYEYTVPNQNVFSTIEYKTQNITFRVSY